MKFVGNLVLSASLIVGVPLAQAATHRQQSNILVEPPAALPEPTQLASQGMLLYSNHFTHAWLYLEQEHGALMSVIDVSEPSRIRLVASVRTGVEKPYDLIQAAHKHYAIARFRDGSGEMLLNLSHPRAPRLTAIPAMPYSPADLDIPPEYPGIELRAVARSDDGQDLQIIEPGTAQRLIATATHVTRQAFRPETGTLFLLGDRGLTVVRNLNTEQDWELSFVDDESQD